jgi:2-polyprenyl-3-methyl-5-hydroxy-6-metoxy-1,4-benzoquinol methylase
MINQIHKFLHPVERGFDPVPAEHVRTYADTDSTLPVDPAFLRAAADLGITDWTGLKVLDFGAGHGRFTHYFHDQGARVTWFDISRNYKAYYAAKWNDDVEFVIGYLDDAETLLAHKYDFVFSRVCINYSVNDRAIIKTIFNLLKPGGKFYIHVNNDSFYQRQSLKTLLNRHLGVKIGHPFPPRGRLAEWVNRMEPKVLWVNYEQAGSDIVYGVAR